MRLAGTSGKRSAGTEPRTAGLRVDVRGQRKILLVEDDLQIAELMSLHLRDVPAQVRIVPDGTDGLRDALGAAYDLFVLDVRLPGVNGLDLCARLRRQGIRAPVMIVSAHASDAERVAGLELGADDYIAKPFSVSELLARARALLRRSQPVANGYGSMPPLRLSNIVVDPRTRDVRVGDRYVELTVREFAILYALASQPGRVFSKTELLESALAPEADVYEHTVTCHINRLRAKIEPDPEKPRHILTVWGVGYKFAA